MGCALTEETNKKSSKLFKATNMTSLFCDTKNKHLPSQTLVRFLFVSNIVGELGWGKQQIQLFDHYHF